MQGWDNFFVATASAAATLTGLIFVAVSFSLAKILETPALPSRALSSLILLLNILIVSLLFLVPSQSANMQGVEVVFFGAITWFAIFKLDGNSIRLKDKEYKKHYIVNMVMDQIAILPYLIAGACFLMLNQNAIYWIVPGIVFSFFKALMDAWVLLVEIHR